MEFWIGVGAVCVVLIALAWWSSGRSKGRSIDPRRKLIQTGAYARSNATQVTFDPRGPLP
jgi:hypothetical protein